MTLALGLVFVAGQYFVWRQLAAQGLYLATTSNSSFFYVFTVMHALHLLGGIVALAYLIAKITSRRAVTSMEFVRRRGDLLAFYGRSVALPARRNLDETLTGKEGN